MLPPLLLVFFPKRHGENARIIADGGVIILLLLFEFLLVLSDIFEEENQVYLIRKIYIQELIQLYLEGLQQYLKCLILLLQQ